MQLIIATPEGKALETACDSVSLPTSSGRIEVLAGHAALATSLAKGVVHVKQGATTESWQIESGFLKVLQNQLTILTPVAKK